jgi:hypothetical protein
MRYPRVLIITSCTGEKRFKPENQLTQEDFMHAARLRKREKQLSEFMVQAGEMYTGMQYIQLMEGVRVLRKALARISHKVVKNGVDKLREYNCYKASSGLIR